MSKPVSNPLNTLGIIGLGMIGGSFALAAREHQLAQTIVGFDHHFKEAQQAEHENLIDRALSLKKLIECSDLIFIAVPVQSFKEIFEAIREHAKKDVLVTDAGSTKYQIIQIAIATLAEKSARYVPAHPIAGSHLSGFQHANGQLFEGRKLIITPHEKNETEVVDQVRDVWQKLNARVYLMDPNEHDRIFAAVSHFPHLLTSAYMNQICEQKSHQLFLMAGTGFRDFTRIAASSPLMWKDVFFSNKTAMLEQLQLFKTQLAMAEKYLQNDDEKALLEWYTKATEARENWDDEQA